MEAERQLLPHQHDRPVTERKVVIFYGEPRSGRSTVAEAICVELQISGFAQCVWEISEGRPNTVEAFVHEILAAIDTLGIRKNIPVVDHIVSDIALPTRGTHVTALRAQLLAALEPPVPAQPIALLIHLDHAETELRDFVAHLSRELRHTALVIVTETPYADTSLGLELEVMPLTWQDIGDYIRYERIPLGISETTSGIDLLYKASYGRPGLLKQVIASAQRYQQQQHCSLEKSWRSNRRQARYFM